MIEFPHLPVYKSAFWIESEKELTCSHFIEATFRGALGYYLKGTRCPFAITGEGFPQSDCRKCELRGNCLYATLFDPAPGKGFEDTTEEIPRPYAIYAEQHQDKIRLELTFFGEHAEKYSEALEVLQELGVMGIGKYNSLFSVTATEELRLYFLDKFAETDIQGESDILLKIESPMSLRKEGKKLSQWNTDAFVRAALRRIYLLSIHQNITIPAKWDYKKMLSLFDNITSESYCKVQSRSRNSTRQNANIDYSGFTGFVLLKDVPPEGVSILKAASLLGVGTGTVMGGGRFQAYLNIPL